MIPVTDSLSIDDSELVETFIRSSGPGGQNVNKVATAVHLRFDVRRSENLPFDVRERAEALAGARLTKDGVIVISADRFRTQDRNRADARERLLALLAKASEPPKRRRATRPTRASREKRLKVKSDRGQVKKLRGQIDSE